MNSNPFESSTFRGANTDLLKGVKRGGYKAGTIGVSDFLGAVPNFNRRGRNPLKAGAGVSQMTSKPSVNTTLKTSAYNLYAQEPVQKLYANFYKK